MKVNFGTLSVTSPVFEHGGEIPSEFIGSDAPFPPLQWQDAPEGTDSFVVLVEDPDAPVLGGISHLVRYGIAADARALGGGDGSDLGTQGLNGLGEAGWIPPAPPPGHGAHYYYFHVYALKGGLDLAPGLSRDALLPAIHDDVLAQARLVGWVAG